MGGGDPEIFESPKAYNIGQSSGFFLVPGGIFLRGYVEGIP